MPAKFDSLKMSNSPHLVRLNEKHSERLIPAKIARFLSDDPRAAGSTATLLEEETLWRVKSLSTYRYKT